MTDIPEEFQDVPRLVKGRNRGKPDFRTKRGKELKAYLEAQKAPMDGGGTEEAGDERFPQAPQEPAQAVVTAAVPSATPVPNLGTSQSGQWLLAQIAEAYPEVRYNQWNRVKATFVHAQRNLLAWRRLTQNR